jgi:hypothetical protein
LLRVTLHQIRDQLIEGDSSAVLGLLMHYPDLPTVTPVLDYADMIKRYVSDLCTELVVCVMYVSAKTNHYTGLLNRRAVP